MCVQEMTLRTSPQNYPLNISCARGDFLHVHEHTIKSNGECKFAIRSQRQVSIDMFQTVYLSLDVRRTECVGQTMFLVMIPASKITSKSSPLQNFKFRRITLDVPQRVEELGEHSI